MIVVPLLDNSSVKNNKDYLKILIEDFKFIEKKLERLKIQLAFETDLEPKLNLEFMESLNSNIYGLNYDIGNSIGYGHNYETEFKKEKSGTRKMFQNLANHVQGSTEGWNKLILSCGTISIPFSLEKYKDLHLLGLIVFNNVYPDLTSNLKTFYNCPEDCDANKLISVITRSGGYRTLLKFIDKELIKINPLQNNDVNTRKRPRENPENTNAKKVNSLKKN